MSFEFFGVGLLCLIWFFVLFSDVVLCWLARPISDVFAFVVFGLISSEQDPGLGAARRGATRAATVASWDGAGTTEVASAA